MAKLTRNKVAYDLTISPYKFVVDYENASLEYVFSSQLYLTKFKSNYEENRNKISESLSNRFNFKIENHLLSDLKLYSSIEKRGFLIGVNGDYIKCLEKVKVYGHNQLIKI